MIFTMKRHATRTDSGLPQFKKRVPSDVAAKVRGRVVSFTLPAVGRDPEEPISFRIGEFAKVSLRTRHPDTAKVRALALTTHLETIWEAVRQGPAQISQRQADALAGEVYHALIAEHGDNPGSPEDWERFKALTRAAAEGRISGVPSIQANGRCDDDVAAQLLFGDATGEELTARINALPSQQDGQGLVQRVGRLTFWALDRRGLSIDSAAELDLMRRVARAALDAAWALKRRSGGDWRADPAAERFPTFEAKPAVKGITLTALFDRWEKETKPAGSTVTTWKGIVAALAKELKHEDAGRITPEEIVRFKDARVALGRSAKTINDSDLAALRALFRYGVTNKLLTRNPAEGVKVAAKRRAGDGKLPYTDAEIGTLLAHAEKETLAYRRWLPLLLVTTGARAGELCQLWGDRVRVEDGIHVLRIEPAQDGGSLKNEGSERTVPLHPAVVASGFLDFVRAKGPGPLFYGTSRKDAARHASVGPRNHLSDWIRSLPGFDDERKAPAHAIRHWWKSVAHRAGMQDSLADHIQGHTTATVAGRYRHFELRTLADAVASIPIPASPERKELVRIEAVRAYVG